VIRFFQQKKYKKDLPALLAALACCGLSALLLRFAPAAAQGARDGLRLCAQAIVPSLFPFFVLSSLFVSLSLRQNGTKRSSRVLQFLFRQPPAALGAIFMGLLGGYPMGARCAAQLLERGLLNRAQAQRLLLFCVNAGPAYLIGVLGSSLMGSRKAGVIALVSLSAASLLMGLAARFYTPPEPSSAPPKEASRSVRFLPGDAVLGAVTQATGAMLAVCAWVVLFSCLCALLKHLPAALHPAIPFLGAVLEVSNGVVLALRTGAALPVLCAVLGWGGLSVHCQILGDLRKTGLRLPVFLAARLLHGALAAAICSQLLRWFPAEQSAAALQGAPILRPWAVSAPAAAALLFFCAFLILETQPAAREKHARRP
jgi:sporulation integral membrane protein YlbJ